MLVRRGSDRSRGLRLSKSIRLLLRSIRRQILTTSEIGFAPTPRAGCDSNQSLRGASDAVEELFDYLPSVVGTDHPAETRSARPSTLSSGGGEFNRQRDAVQPLADPCYCGRILGTDRKSRSGCRCAVSKQAHRVIQNQFLGWREMADILRHRKGGNPP